MPPKSRFLQVRLRIERDKLVDWAVLANLSEDERTMSSGLRINMQKVNGSLQEIRLVLLELVKLSGSYDADRDPDSDYGSADETATGPPDPTSVRSSLALQRKALSFVKTTRAFPRRLRWANFDETEFELLLAKLAALNEKMVYFFDKRQQDMQVQMQHDSFVSLLYATDKFEQLLDLMASLQATTKYRGMPTHEVQLMKLTRFKAFNLAVEASEDGRDEALIKSHLGDPPPVPGAASRPICLETAKLLVMGEDTREKRPCGAWGLYDDAPVWVEWRYCTLSTTHHLSRRAKRKPKKKKPQKANMLTKTDQPIDYRGKPPAYLESRFAKLATLLRDNQKPDAFRVPDCLGYLADRDNYRFGFMFQGQGAYYPPRLSDLIVSRQPKPSLTTRVQMARAVTRSVMYLHAASWTHKRLRSEHIVFPYSLAAGPYVTGFDYARPIEADTAASLLPPEEMTSAQLYADLYRHPAAQFHEAFEGSGPFGFRALYDIYSLGVVLYEIGMWKPIHVILGVHNNGNGDKEEGHSNEGGTQQGEQGEAKKGPKLTVDEVRDVQTRLLSQYGLMSLAAEVGDVYMAAVASCLSGDFGFDGFEGVEDRQGNYEARLQLEFGQRVIRKLDKIMV